MRMPYIHDEIDAAGRRVVVTGASSTVGRAIAEEFVARGARVIGLDLAPRESDPIRVFATDLSDQESVRRSVAAAIEDLGGLDILINTVDAGDVSHAEFAPTAELFRQLDMNLAAGWRVAAEAVPALVESRGRVVNVASLNASLQLPFAAAYAASKRAFVAWSDSLRLELTPYVDVAVVYPPMMDGDMRQSLRNEGLHLDGLSGYEPIDDIVDAVVNGALSRRPRRDIPTSGKGGRQFFLARHFPGLVDVLVARRTTRQAEADAFDRAAATDPEPALQT